MENRDEIRLNLCPKCPGRPMMMIVPNWPHPMVGVVCTKCGHSGPKIYFSEKGGILYQGQKPQLLPDLAKARRQAAAAWNEEPAERWKYARGTVV